MEIHLTLNGRQETFTITPNETLMHMLRRHALFSVKHGCETGECGNCTALIDGKPTTSCILLASQINGRSVTTLEALGATKRDMHPLQQAFVETGAIQCGYCTPAQILCAKALLDYNPNPDEGEVRAAIAGVLAASRLLAVNQSSGSSDFLLNAIAATVIGGTSLFGGRGSAWSALLGALVIGSISNGMDLLAFESSLKFMITAAVLLAAVTVDAVTRRRREAVGR